MEGEVTRYMPTAPINDVEGDIDTMPMWAWAGQGVGLVKIIQPAGDIVRKINSGAEAALARLGQ